jgi:hypothetical protein
MTTLEKFFFIKKRKMLDDYPFESSPILNLIIAFISILFSLFCIGIFVNFSKPDNHSLSSLNSQNSNQKVKKRQ